MAQKWQLPWRAVSVGQLIYGVRVIALLFLSVKNRLSSTKPRSIGEDSQGSFVKLH